MVGGGEVVVGGEGVVDTGVCTCFVDEFEQRENKEREQGVSAKQEVREITTLQK